MAGRTDYETEEQRAAFRLFLEHRTLRSVWERSERGEATIKRWSTWFNWVSRADAITRGEPDPGPPPKEGDPRPLIGEKKRQREEAARRRREVPRVEAPEPVPPAESASAAGSAAAGAPPSGPSTPGTTTPSPAEMSAQDARRIVRRGMDAGLGGRAEPSQEIRAVRTLWVTAVKTLLAGQCTTVKGTCPYCNARVELPGCGQAPNFKPSAADVKSLMTLMREVEADERAKEQEAAADRRTLDEVAHSIAAQLEQLGGLELLVAIAEHMGLRGDEKAA